MIEVLLQYQKLYLKILILTHSSSKNLYSVPAAISTFFFLIRWIQRNQEWYYGTWYSLWSCNVHHKKLYNVDGNENLLQRCGRSDRCSPLLCVFRWVTGDVVHLSSVVEPNIDMYYIVLYRYIHIYIYLIARLATCGGKSISTRRVYLYLYHRAALGGMAQTSTVV